LDLASSLLLQHFSVAPNWNWRTFLKKEDEVRRSG
jgi:hypothetical protein